MQEDPDGRPVRVAAVNDYELVVQGVATMLSRFEGLVVCERVVIGRDVPDGPVDVALYDTYGRAGLAEETLRELVAHPGVGHVALFSLDLRPEVVARARAAGAAGAISKALPAEEIAASVRRVAEGHEVLALPRTAGTLDGDLQWPGRARGLTERESEVLVLCADGLTNREIAEVLYIGVETVKTHLANAYRRLGVRNRTEAAALLDRSGALERSGGT